MILAELVLSFGESNAEVFLCLEVATFWTPNSSLSNQNLPS